MVTIIKLVNTIEIIGTIIEENKQVIVMDNPLQITYTQRNSATCPTIALHRYIPFCDTNIVTFKQEHVLSRVPPLASMVSYYNASLKNIQETVDPSIDQDLSIASGDADLTPEGQAKLALIEKHLTKATVN